MLHLVSIALLLLATSASAQTRLPFVGEWGGGPATCAEPFRFASDSYTPAGGKQLRITKVERNGRDYLLSFADGYRVTLLEVTAQRMTWHSPISGDTFDLIRCR